MNLKHILASYSRIIIDVFFYVILLLVCFLEKPINNYLLYTFYMAMGLYFGYKLSTWAHQFLKEKK
ncbi:hypothetical protein DMA11_17205 [Marinilabiliaceae bacterium JC017]|nr:hypothetical protein DMA11_17205 [Marinilabiliaceae bacterium JC017]